MQLVITYPALNPYGAPANRFIHVEGNVDAEDNIIFKLTRESLEDIVKIAQAQGLSIYIKERLET